MKEIFEPWVVVEFPYWEHFLLSLRVSYLVSLKGHIVFKAGDMGIPLRLQQYVRRRTNE